MAIPTPDTFIDWAVNSDSEKTRPGTTLTEDGWAVGDAPASSHFNYILNSASVGSGFVPRVLPSQVAWGNIEYSTGDGGGPLPFGRTSSTVFSVHFLAGRWYILEVTLSNQVNVFDSEDGITWNARLSEDTLTTDTNITRPVLVRGRFAFGCDNRFFISSDATIENLTNLLSPWTDIANPRELVYDPVSDLLVCVGSDGAGNGRIETSSDFGATWTVRDSRAGDEYLSVAVSPSGSFLAATDSGSTMRISTDGTTWIAGPVATNPFERVVWSNHVNGGAFLCRDSVGSLFYVPEASTVEVDTGLDPDVAWLSDEMFIVRDQVTSAVSAVDGYVSTWLGTDLGVSAIGYPVGLELSEYVGGNGRIIFPYVAADNTIQKATAFYGAQNGTT